MIKLALIFWLVTPAPQAPGVHMMLAGLGGHCTVSWSRKAVGNDAKLVTIFTPAILKVSFVGCGAFVTSFSDHILRIF